LKFPFFEILFIYYYFRQINLGKNKMNLTYPQYFFNWTFSVMLNIQ